MNDFDEKADLAETFLRAGNFQRTKELCREVLEKDPENYLAYQVLFRLRMEQNDYSQATALCNWRLERLPNCAETLFNKFSVSALIGNKRQSKALLKNFSSQHADRPILVSKANIMYHAHAASKRKAIKLIKAALQDGQIDKSWLDAFEHDARSKSGHIFTSYRLSKEFLEEDPNSVINLRINAHTSLLMGRLFSAVNQAKRVKELDPRYAKEANEVIWVSKLALLPIFWPVLFFIVLNACFTSRLPYLVRIIPNWILIISSILMAGFIVLPLQSISETLHGIGAGVIAIATIGGIIYMLYFFGRFGSPNVHNQDNVNLATDY